MGSQESTFEPSLPALDVVVELAAEPVATPELLYSALPTTAEPVSVDAVLSGQHSALTVQWADGSFLSFDHAQLDRSVIELAGSQPGLQASGAGETPWNAQQVLRGTSGNDRFVVEDRPNAFSDQFAVSFDATSGSDRYQGTAQLDRVDYDRLSSDSLSGLYITDSPDRLPLVANNLPPLIAAEFAADDLLVYKNYNADLAGSEHQVDLLRDIEVLSLGNRDDVLDLSSEHPSLVVDFAGGMDRAKLASTGDMPDVARFLGLERLEWTPLDAEGQARTTEPIAFAVQEWQEDATSLWPVETYPPDASGDPWQLSSFAMPGAAPAPPPDWVELLQLPPTPELVGEGRLVISRNFVADAADPTLIWLELSVHDLRPGGLGLVGLEISLDWNASALELVSDSFTTDEVLNRDHLPLFQNLGTRSIANGRESITGLGAAALPRGGQGLALGLSSQDGGQTLFARLGFRRENAQAPIDLQLTPTLTPAAGGRTLAAQDLLVLDDSSPAVWVIRAHPDQQQVGSHAFSLSRGSGANAELKHLAVAVREVNDVPQAVAVAPDELNISLNQNSSLIRALSGLFSDQDDGALTYTLLNGPTWLQIDQASGVLSGQPGNAQVGQHTLTVQASDGRGGTARQTLRLEVLNVNDSPVIGAVALQPPQLRQGQSFTYRLPTGLFNDPDLLVDPQERLTYTLVAAAADQPLPSWIRLDPSSGTLSGTAGPADVGDSRFIVRATDRAGLSVDQAVVLSVANVNDAPSRTSALAAFLALQKPTAAGVAPPDENNPLALFSGLQRTLDLNSWFSDPDLGIDASETLRLAVSLDPGDGTLIDLGDPEVAPDWLQWDQTSGLLSLRPSVDQIGEHVLRVRASDAAGLSAAAVVPLLVRHRNSAPYQQLTNLDAILQASQLEGVVATTPLQRDQLLTGVSMQLAEDAAFRIELPASLFGDIDLTIDPAERISYALDAPEGLPFLFDPLSLSLSGTTAGLALDAAGGRASWSTRLIGSDAAGESVSFELELVLQRSPGIPDLRAALAPEQARFEEGAEIPLTQLLDLRLSARPGEVLELQLERLDNDPQPLILRNDSGQPLMPQANGSWLLRGTSAEVSAQLAQLSLVVPDAPHAVGSFSLRASAQTELGTTGLCSETVAAEISFSLDPIADAPIWQRQSDQGAQDPFALNTFSDYLAAELVDPREQLLYVLQLPDTPPNLLVTDRTGLVLGERTGNEILLNPEQWAMAMLRSDGADPHPVQLRVRALSSEPSTGLGAPSITKTVSWQPTPLLSADPQTALITPKGVQRSSEPSEVKLALVWPEAARSGQLVMDLPLGSSVTLPGFQAQTGVFNGKQRIVISLSGDAEHPLPRELNLQVASPEIFRGNFEGSLQLLSSVRPGLPAEGLTPAALDADRAAGLTRQLDPIPFQWAVVQVARTPEFGQGADVSFDAQTGALQIALRRGSSSSGYRNPAESLVLSVGNIPAGYALAERVNGAYKAVGATDAFGTMTLFTLPAAPAGATPAAMEAWLKTKLYLVALDKKTPPLSGSETLSLAITAQISDQPGGDSRSAAVTRLLQLEPFSSGPAPRLRIDPLILNLSGGDLALTTLEQGVSFAMLPQAPAVPTAWLSPLANAGDQRNAALLVRNDSSNDASDGEVTISSITELLSEYFQTDGLLRSFASGSAALASLNSNADQLLNASDQAWSELQLWFDDGDAISEANELVAIADVLTSIDLGSLETVSQQPNWAAGNAVLRRLSAVNLDAPASTVDLYDVGLQVAPAGSAPLPLTVQGPLQLQEGGEPVTLQLSSAGSDHWQEDGLETLTLVRLSGLSEALTPSLGVKDSRGDWLFTWADLTANGGQLQITPSPDWSGSANLQLLITQLQPDGTLLSSALTSLALDVAAVADAPVLQINSATTREDTPLSLSALLGRSALSDTDGSETLHYELHGLPAGARLARLNAGLTALLDPGDGGVYRITPSELDGLLFVPPTDAAGQLSFEWHAVAQEDSNGNTATIVATVLINVRAVADAPLMPALAAAPPALVEGQSIALGALIQQPVASTGLSDTDGSEQLRLEFNLPMGVRLLKAADPNWTPISAQTLADGRRVVVINAADAAQLQLADRGVRPAGAATAPESLQLAVTRISRESSTGDQARSNTLTFNLAFDRQARPAILTLPDTPAAAAEDQGGVALNALLQARPAQASDVLSYRLSGLAAGLTLIDAQGSLQVVPQNTPLTLASLDGWRLQAAEHQSGQFSVDLQVISTPPGQQGATAQTAIQRLPFTITAVADTPLLGFGAAPAGALSIASNGWLDLGALQFNLSTPDQDGSERLSVVIAAVNGAGEPVPLPSQVQFNVPTRQLDDGSWVIQQADLAGLKLYLGEIADDLQLAITPRSRDGNAIGLGQPSLIDVAANAQVRVPLLEVQGVLQGLEDQPMPLLSQLAGVINAQLRGSGSGQTLELELTGLPQGSRLVALQNGAPDNELPMVFTAALNRNDAGELTTSLRLPYSQWQNVHWQAPTDQSGTFSFAVQAFSVGRSGQTLASEISTVQALVTAVNDAPRLATLEDLAPIDEGVAGSWDLRSRFADVDNDRTDLVITAQQVGANGSTIALPAWLSLGSDGVLSGTPSNSDVGVLQLQITAIDPLGELTSQQVSLTVGDVNAAPVFNAQAMQGWTAQSQSGATIYLRSLDLREQVVINLSSAFNDADLINNDQLSYAISRDGVSWSQALTGLAQIANGTLTIQPQGKENVGVQAIQLRATDLRGASNIQSLRLTVRNINDPPVVTRQGAALVRAGVWQETVAVNQGQTDWQLNLEGLFRDADSGDRLDQILPNALPPWLTYTPASSGTGGILRGTPANSDVGLQTLQWQALDNAGATATYRLRIDVRNVNDGPQLRPNPDLSGLGPLINGFPTVDQDAYGRLDLSELFSDPDSPYGDALSYSIASVIKDGNTLETPPEWLGLTYRSTVAPDATGMLLLEPVLYRIGADGTTGSRLAPGEISQLAAGTALRVVVEATDDRPVARKGLIGVDLDVTWSSSLELVPNTAQINSDLPLFRQITQGNGSLRVQAGALPDGALAVGAPVGDQARDNLLTFDVVLNDPGQRVVIGLSQGEGISRDGLSGREAETFDQANSVIHSFASKIYLEALQPSNDAVGRYQVVLNANDLAGEQVSKTLTVAISNRNDAPRIDASLDVQGKTGTQALVDWLAAGRLEGDRSQASFRLFTDPDLRYGDDLVYTLLPGRAGSTTEAWAYPDSISMRQSPDGSLTLNLSPPSSLKAIVEQQFKLTATDAQGLSVSTDWFKAIFRPMAQATVLTRTDQNEPLKALELGAWATKNATLDLQAVLDLNAVTLADPAGDRAFLKLLVNQSDAQLSLAGSNATAFYERQRTNEGVLFTVDLNALSQLSGAAEGSLEGLQLTLEPNQFERLPRSLSPNLRTGVPLQLWTETRVQGDATNTPQFNVAVTDRSTLWIPLQNTRPNYSQPGVTQLNADFFEPTRFTTGQTLIHLSDVFYDLDLFEQLTWELETPKALKGLLELDTTTGEVKLAARVTEIGDLPTGSHRLLVRAKDSSGQLGDATGVASGSIRLLITAPSESNSTLSGLNLLTQLDSSGINAILAKQENEQTESERQVVTLLEKLDVQDDKLASFIQKLEAGSLAVLSGNGPEQATLLIDASLNPGSLLTEANITTADAQDLESSNRLLDGREIVNTPLGKIEFTLDTQGRDFGIVELKMEEGGVDFDTLFKSDANGNPLIFRGERVSYSTDYGDVDQWLDNLSYGIYLYDPADPRSALQNPVISINADETSLVAALLTANPQFDLTNLGKIDGSGYLIDLDANGTVDLVRLLLIDQGWFDTRQDVIGLIGDPLIPAKTTTQQRATGPFADSSGPSRLQSENSPSGSEPQTATNGKSGQNSTASANQSTDDSPANGSRGSAGSTSRPTSSSDGGGSTSPATGQESSQGSTQKEPGESDLRSESDQPETSKSRPGDSLQNWLRDRSQDLSNLTRSLTSPLKEASETSIGMALGMLLVPMLTERTATAAAKAMDRDLRLKLQRRDPNFNGRWLVISRHGGPEAIQRKQGRITLEQSLAGTDSDGITILPGFSPEGISLLSQLLTISRAPGILVSSLSSTLLELQKNDYPEINWHTWLDRHFDPSKSNDRDRAKSTTANDVLHELKELISRATNTDPALADVVMFSQLLDCANQLGLSPSTDAASLSLIEINHPPADADLRGAGKRPVKSA